MSDDQFWAHFTIDYNGKQRYQTLSTHLVQTAYLAGQFASEFGNRDWGELLGYWHDLGKFHPQWQQYIREQISNSVQSENSHSHKTVNHSTVGAVLAFKKCQQLPPSRVFGYCIAGHHAGLPDWYPDEAGGDLQNRLYTDVLNALVDTEDLDVIRGIPEARPFLEKEIPTSPPLGISSPSEFDKKKEHLHLWIRMLFSCLVDADFLDTEYFMQPELSAERGKFLSLTELKKKFDVYILEKENNAPQTPINKKRKAIRETCQQKARLNPGFFSLTVPTGGGKTLSSLAFAFEHALIHHKKRIIYVIPFTSIIEQTARIFKYGTDNEIEIEERKKRNEVLFGEDQVIEHHSNLDPEQETIPSKLACENWEAPIIVTTNVQLFESLFASRPSACRKLHNLVNSIIILDEVQMLPPEYLRAILSVLRGLVECFGVTVVLMTATQPVLEGNVGLAPHIIDGLKQVRPIIEDPEALAKAFDRVELLLPQNITQEKTWEELRDELLQYEQVLCIVNSRKDCRDFHSLMPKGTFHLSALMCGEERSVIISEIKNKLRRKEPIRVISTQVVEAGVDIDFPVVYRALAGFDSIAQAAGRCNREGKLSFDGRKGKLVVFVPQSSAPVGILRKGEEACKEMLRNRELSTLSPSLFTEYFQLFYSRLNTFDKPEFYNRLIQNGNEFAFQFRTFASHFKLIEENTESVLVLYENPTTGFNSQSLINELRYGGPNRLLLRKLQRFIVNVHQQHIKTFAENHYIEMISGYWVQAIAELYKPGLGLQVGDSQLLGLMVI